MQLKTGGKAVLIFALVGGIAFGVNWYGSPRGWFDSKPTQASSIPPRVDLPGTASTASGGGTTTVVLPPAVNGGGVKIEVLAWNAEMGLMAANGDVTTAPGSLMAKRGVKVTLERQDDYSKMQSDMVAFAEKFKSGVKNPDVGAPLVVIMGDGGPAFITGANEGLKKLGYSVEVVAGLGYSRGEDKCMLSVIEQDGSVSPRKYIDNPQAARGKVIAGVERDGDIHICFKWAGDNQVPINADAKTYDPDAINFMVTSSFVDADEKLIAGACETRPVVQNGKKTGEQRKVCVEGTATWTPGDSKVVQKRGGLVTVASTKEYAFQMPATLIGIKQWMEANPSTVDNLIAAALEGGELVNSNDAALTKAAEVAHKVFAEPNTSPAYWKSMYKGTVLTDKYGIQVPVGGSTANGFADNEVLFGLNGKDKLYKRVYVAYGDIDVKYYPVDFPSYTPYDKAVNTSYLQRVIAKSTNMTAPALPNYATMQTTGTFARRSVSIEFETGKATFTPRAITQLDDVLNQLSASGLKVQINGHTDTVGNQASNIELSKKRAEAVKQFIVQNAAATFPADRIGTRGYGDTIPVSDNKTAEGRAKNRRVEILMLAN